jgi:lipopolysaccharide/colanic/teichoic acid biosynthesis glycosyltransferase
MRIFVTGESDAAERLIAELRNRGVEVERAQAGAPVQTAQADAVLHLGAAPAPSVGDQATPPTLLGLPRLAIENRSLLQQAHSAFSPSVSVAFAADFICGGTWRDKAFVLVSERQNGNRVYARLRWLAEKTVALAALSVTALPMLALGLAVRATSPGPALFGQERVGLRRQNFTLWKLRSMNLGTKQAGTHEISKNAVTPIGRFMRKWKLDELPQSFNILRGEMSLVGPRPSLTTQMDVIEARARLQVLDVVPGLTGLAQVRGVDMKDAETLARIDAHYCDIRNLWLDLRIVLATVGIGRRALCDLQIPSEQAGFRPY